MQMQYRSSAKSWCCQLHVQQATTSSEQAIEGVAVARNLLPTCLRNTRDSGWEINLKIFFKYHIKRNLRQGDYAEINTE